MAQLRTPAAAAVRLPAVAVQVSVSVVALSAVVWWALQQDAPRVPQTSAELGALALALALYALVSCVRAERWHRIVAASGVVIERSETYRLTAVCYMGNNVLPARAGDLLRVFLLGPLAGTSRRNALGTVVAERLLDALALALVFVAVTYGLLRGVAVPTGRLALVGALVAVVAVAGAVAAAVAVRVGAFARLRELVVPVLASTRALAGARGAALLGLSLGVWMLEAAVYFVVGLAVPVDVDPLGALYVVALTNLFALLPAAPGYVGTFDAAVLFAATSLGNTGSEALAFLLLLRFVLFVPITVVGLSFFLTRYGGLTLLRRARSASARD